MNRYQCMELFLLKMKQLVLLNPNLELSRKSMVYPSLVTIGSEYGDISYLFNEWKKYHSNYFFDGNNPDFIGFNNGQINCNEIKIYIPLKSEFLYENVNKLLIYLNSNNISYQLKVSKNLRNDNVCLRVNSLEDAFKIYNDILSKPSFKSNSIRPNPFIPSIDNIGFAMDNNYSFNSILSMLITDFINLLKSENKLDLVTLNEFNKYVIEFANRVKEDDLKDICLLIAKSTSKDFEFSDFIMHANIKLANKYSNDRVKIVDPKFYFENAIIETTKKIPDNTKIAILQYLKNNNPNYFTNYNNARVALIEHVNPNLIINLMRSKLNEFGVSIPNSDSELVDIYLTLLLKKENIFEDEPLKKENNY